MKYSKSDFDKTFNMENLFVYGFFEFKKKKIKNDIDGNYHEYLQSNFWHRDIWDMSSFYQAIYASGSSIDIDAISSSLFKQKRNWKKIKRRDKCSKIESAPIILNCYKSEFTNRKMKYVNIYNYLILCWFFNNFKDNFEEYYKKDENSTSKFYYNTFRKNKILKIEKLELKNHRFVLKTDISNFYPSLYTHTIPWVFMGKENAKAQRWKGMWNVLDRLVQSSQRGETKGIPVGSLTSRILAETYQLKIDDEMMNNGLTDKFTRFVDDYTFYFNDLSEENKILKILHKYYSYYELQLHEQKTIRSEYPDEDNSQFVLKSFLNYYGDDIFIIHEKIESFCNFYLELRRNKKIKGPQFTFELKTYFRIIRNIDQTILEKMFNAYKHVFNLILEIIFLDIQYIYFSFDFFDEFKLLEIDGCKEVLAAFNGHINEKLKHYLEQELNVECIQILSLAKLYNIEIKDEHLLEIIDKSDAFSALLSLELLKSKNSDPDNSEPDNSEPDNSEPDNSESDNSDPDNLVNKIITRLKNLVCEEKGQYCFRGENYIFEYEIFRIYKNPDMSSVLETKIHNSKDIKNFYANYDDTCDFYKFYNYLASKNCSIIKH